MTPEHLVQHAERVLDAAREKDVRIACAESCTGGLVAACLTEVAGSSDVFDRGVVCYSNDAKQDLLGVSDDALERYGAVSEDVVLEMAAGALKGSDAALAVSISGIAGPGGGSEDKPVGLVYFAIADRTGGELFTFAEEHRFGDIGRTHVRERSVETALGLLLRQLTG